MATIAIAAKYSALAMNSKNNLSTTQRNGYSRIAGRILKSVIESRCEATGQAYNAVASETVDELFLMARDLLNEWDVSHGFSPRYR